MNARKRMECLERMRQARQRAMQAYLAEYHARQEKLYPTEPIRTKSNEPKTLHGKRIA
ncbi:hypothetical protein bcgnr5393_58990 [Bacillus cereus]